MIEDDEGHARLIEKNIRRAGVGNEIIPFVNGTDALNYLLGDDRSGAASAKRQQLILLDLNLPDMTGIDILQKLKGNKHTKRSPIVVARVNNHSSLDTSNSLNVHFICGKCFLSSSYPAREKNP
jgi:CheY-like chemotaxis protein